LTNFIELAFLDVWSLSASLRSRMNLLMASPLLVHTTDGWVEEHTEKWPQLRNVVSRVTRLPAAKEYELGLVTVELLSPGEATAWEMRAPWPLQLLHLPIVTNPAAMVFSGPQGWHIKHGVLTWVNNAVLCSEVNFGEFPRIHLVLEVRKKEES
jgi:hypothetical protein